MKKNNYLITLVRSNHSRDVYVPSLARPENAAIMKSSEFAQTALQKVAKSANCKLNFVSNPDEFGIIGVTCDVATAEAIQKQTNLVASVLNIHEPCVTDPWDLLDVLRDEQTRIGFAELRNERRFQKDVEAAFSRINRASLREFCADLIKLSGGELIHLDLPAIGNYLGLSQDELSQFMILSPNTLQATFPSPGTSATVINRAYALLVIAYHLRKIFERHDRATAWMLRTQPEGWQHKGLSAKDCLLNGYYMPVYSHLTEITRRPDRPLVGGTHGCSHDYFHASRRF
ncbi:MAG: hypothetical protein K2Y22_15155 [Candidatus Obscuribacterales bacterium]|nr:hypothetical protein [Candidatus Obscuribacterales bacterium]